MTVVGVDLENVLRMAISELTNAGVEGAIIDSRILASAAFDLSREEILREPNATLKISDIALFKEMLNRRCAREPVSRIIGMREFRGLEFKVAPSTLDPRPDSETIVEAVFDIASEMPHRLRILDLGTGTGCLLLSVLHALPAARGVGTEIDPDAAACAIQNAQALRLSDRAEIVCGNWVEGVDGRFDIIFSNPPYIPSDEIQRLAPEVALYEPVRSLDGGADGLDAYREISELLREFLSPSGRVVFEIGAQQGDAVTAIFCAAGFVGIKNCKDLAGRDRALIFSKA